MNWKIIAIIFIILFVTLLSFNLWGMISYSHQKKMTRECYFDFCKNYSQAQLKDGVCYCYSPDVLGNLQIADTKVMN